MLLNGALERPRAKYRIETGLGQLVQCPRGKLDIHLACAQPGTQVLYLEFGDTMQLFAAERIFAWIAGVICTLW